MEMESLSRPVVINCCKDRTLTYAQRGQRPFNGVALPVFSVNTVEQAEALIMLVGIRQYEQHPLLPDKPWMKIDIDSKRYLVLDDLPKVTTKLERIFAGMRK